MNVYFQIMKDENGNGSNNIDESNLLSATARLNLSFNPYKIFFKYRGFNTNIATDNANDFSVIKTQSAPCSFPSGRDLINYSQNEGFFSENSINIFLVNAIASGSSCSTTASGYKDRKSIFIKSGYLSSSTLQHEMGHVFALRHIHDKRFDNDVTMREHVTRDQSSSDYNAIYAGDKVADTYAAYAFPPIISGTCEYNEEANNQVDDLGVPYINIQVNNFLGYVTFPTCRQVFTNGQATRMRCYYDLILHNYDRDTDVAALYEPYDGEYFFAGPDIPNNNITKFQYGFDYKFVDCGKRSTGEIEIYNVPTDFDDTSFSYNSNIIISEYNKYWIPDHNSNEISHPNHTAILIEQLDMLQPQKCYNNFNKSAINGSVIRFVDDIPSNNITIQQKNAQEINDDALIQNLQQGLYKIEKNFNDGSKNEIIIYKSDN